MLKVINLKATTRFSFVLLAFSIALSARAQCFRTVRVQKADEVLIRFDMNTAPIKRINPSYFGFNIEWVGFQSDLWNAETGSVHPDVVAWLNRLGGAIYRYPGGTVANYFQWRESVGADRRPQKAVAWTGPIPMSFGINEYFRFLQAVMGKAWVVANIYGEFGREHPIAAQAAEAAAFAQMVDLKSASTNVSVVRWELGNELDRGVNPMSPEKYANNANSVSSAILKAVPNTSFVAIWPDYNAFPGMSASEYARRISDLLSPEITEFAQHMYFDGPPGGPPVTNRLLHMCELITVAKTQGKPSTVWVTEFGRWPPGKTSDPKWSTGFPLTANLASAISTADFLIGTTQIKEIRGGMIHSLSSSKGPWPMFHRHGNHFGPSAVFLSLVLLRQGLVGDVFRTEVTSPYDSRTNNPLVRAVAVASPDKTTLWLTLVNRGDVKTSARILGAPPLEFLNMHIAEIAGIHNETGLANNYKQSNQIAIESFSNDGLRVKQDASLTLWLPANSIMTIRLNK